ncbi:KREMEN2 [Branchiostoma lanceolatum]|uniref:KREMEN2 protein n=1 Tax=Branchiostoma lanceolatum TaxID=7740 RepID=A0A8K0EPD2_BRALA|nr:KREMEN2 [Branchiostoma lanceolatum]
MHHQLENEEFQTYVNLPENLYVRNGTLFLKPTLAADRLGEKFLVDGVINLRGEGHRACGGTAVGYPWRYCEDMLYLGCYRDGGSMDSRDLSGDNMTSADLTPKLCLDYCAEAGYTYAGVQYGVECFCGNSFGQFGAAPESDCTIPCGGDAGQMCGNGWKNSVYTSAGGTCTLENWSGCYLAGGTCTLENWNGCYLAGGTCTLENWNGCYLAGGTCTLENWNGCYLAGGTCTLENWSGCYLAGGTCTLENWNGCYLAGGTCTLENWNGCYLAGGTCTLENWNGCYLAGGTCTLENWSGCYLAGGTCTLENWNGCYLAGGTCTLENWNGCYLAGGTCTLENWNGCYLAGGTCTLENWSDCYLAGGTCTLENWNGCYLAGGTCTLENWSGCYLAGSPTQHLPPVLSARLTTANSFSFRYGKVEVIAKMPTGDWIWPGESGIGTGNDELPAVWLLPQAWAYGDWPKSGEIDIVETRVGNRNLYASWGASLGIDVTTSTLHWGSSGAWPYNGFYKTRAEKEAHTGTYGSDFHKWTMVWTDQYLKFSVDDELMVTVSPPDGFWALGDLLSWFSVDDELMLTVSPPDGFWALGDFGLPDSDNPWSGAGRMAPFDQDFYLILNVATGGTNGFFMDDYVNMPHPKPWSNSESRSQAMASFWRARDQWLPTWSPGTNNGEDAAMQVKSVKVWKFRDL